MPEDIFLNGDVISFYQECMQGTGNDLISQKHKKISTPTAYCSGGFLAGSVKFSFVVSSHPPVGFLFYLCSLVSEHKARSIKNCKRGLKAVLVFNIQNPQRISFSAMEGAMLCFCWRIPFAWQSYFRHFSYMFIWIWNKICTNHFCIIQMECWVVLVPKQTGRSPSGTQLAFCITAWWWLLSLKRLWGARLALEYTKRWVIKIQTTQSSTLKKKIQKGEMH